MSAKGVEELIASIVKEEVLSLTLSFSLSCVLLLALDIDDMITLRSKSACWFGSPIQSVLPI